SIGCLSDSAFARRCVARSSEVRCNNSSMNASGPAARKVLVLPLLDGHSYPELAVGRGYPTREAARPQFQPYSRVVGPEVRKGDEEVQDVEVLRRRKLRKGPPLADGRITAIGADNEVRWEVMRPIRAVGSHPDDTVLCPDQVPNRSTHVEPEGRV